MRGQEGRGAMSRLQLPAARAVGRVLLALGVAAAGGAAFTALAMPAAWLVGAMVATSAAAVAGCDVDLPRRLRDLAFLLLGISIGSSATPESVRQLAAWPASAGLLALSVVATMVAGAAWLERVHGWDRTTARFAAMPGAFSAVVVIASASAADMPRVVLAQSLRIFTLVLLMPPLISLVTGGAHPPPVAAGVAGVAGAAANSLPEAALVLAVAAAVAALLHRLDVPAALLLGAMVASTALHAGGVVHGRFPQPLVIAGFVATGAVIGARFRGTSPATLARTAPGALAGILLALAISAGFAGLGAWWLGMPLGKVWLAYAPGGVEAMAAMALALGLDPAFVGAHHVLRIIGLNIVSPAWLGRRRPR